jgi:hypothetical protein
MLCAGMAQAAQFTINSDISGGGESYYSGSDAGVYVSDGGYDAFDGFGMVSNLGTLSLHRQVEALSDKNIYRFLDTYTNKTGGWVQQQVRFSGDLGSDSWTAVDLNSPFRGISYQTYSSSYDPVVAVVNGNNAWAEANMSKSYTNNDDFAEAINIGLNPGESLSVLNLAFLAYEEPSSVANRPNDIDLARSRSLELVSDPYLDGLTEEQVDGIVNFSFEDAQGDPRPPSVPEPSTLILLGAGLAGLLVIRRRKLTS